MPIVAPKSTILLTGASGFVAAHLGQQLLQRGFKVRGTVRSAAKGQFLVDLYAKEGLTEFEYVIVEDVEQEGVFDECVKGVDGIAHTASPFHFNVTDPYELINPAVQGTVNILRSALKEPKVQRVVITSSVASVINPYTPGYNFTEEDWNTHSPEQVTLKGNECSGIDAYRASKALAERAAWKFLEEHTIDGKAPFDIATINPPLVFGPIIHECTSAKALNTSVGAFYAYLNGAKQDKDAVVGGGAYVDVRDVAQLHIEALVTPEASNKRFLVSNSTLFYQAWLDIIHSPAHADLLAAFPKAVRGIPGTAAPIQSTMDITRAKATFNWAPIAFEKTVVDMTESLAERQKAW